MVMVREIDRSIRQEEIHQPNFTKGEVELMTIFQVVEFTTISQLTA